jgi:hypothetical protein
MALEVKTVGASGQISLGKRNAGRIVSLEEIEEGVWLIKAARLIPENELWLHTPAARARLDRGIAWAERNPPKGSNLKALERRLRRRR